MIERKLRNSQKQNSKTRFISGLTSREVIELLESLESVKISYDQLYYYEATDLIIPSIRHGGGKGVKRLYSVEDVVVLRWLVNLNKQGISVQGFRSIIGFLREKMPEVLKKPQNWELVTTGKSVRFYDKINSRTLDVLKDSGQYLFFP